MCGIAGFYNRHLSQDEAQQKLGAMLDAIVHRGPDDFGMWQNNGLHLGHRRLAIHDLSAAGHQPMPSASGRYHIAFNGEIYNFEELRQALPAQSWRGSSDTEVMLAAFEHWGIEQAIDKFNGMFGFAVWDMQEQTLTLARDRFGEKPVYYFSQGDYFGFSSELSAIEALHDISLTVDRAAVSRQLETSYIPAPLTIYKEVKKLPPGSVVTFKNGQVSDVKAYWTLADTIERAQSQQFSDEQEAIDCLESELLKAVKLRMASDVPLGAFLSGGVDSSLVVALMQAQSNSPVNTFSIGFNVEGYNEAVFAKEVAEHLGTNHTERYLNPTDALDIVPKMGHIFDEPFSDASQLPTYLVSAIAKEKVTVCLSGDGGDELFSGYKRYQATPDIWKKINKFPCRSVFAKVIQSAPTSVLDKVFAFLSPLAAKYGRKGAMGAKLKTLSGWLKAQSIEELYELSMMHWKDVNGIVIGCESSDIWSPSAPDFSEAIERMMYQDSIAYLPGDILTKVDRTAMSVSLEGRIPLLDPRVAETAWRLPMNMKQRGNCGKWALKQVLYKYLPQEMMERPKMGFGVPIHDWLRGELKGWAQDLLSPERLTSQGLLNPEPIGQALQKHIVGEENNAAMLWDVLMLQAWLDANPARKGRL
ncbi:asparagine synthase (glutamine-hydrolyzing) [Pseudoalteromonas luteoviolacea]|uniref:asparagine synthase (glutamine-hydrolyzing) n=1 Tax=Pseudoalteromonas luteoviolacea TaxID=43657 RepID=UPI001B3931B4|nr:asparagine synthase (glutamine-hydrolyzing) [Pseudoalteromonas luteoviolacea]MBQ4838297.1 asparagine synthase (glutamine-hydrolyzing) [Pseudoalteromonas luteoviolacea]